MDIKNMNLEQLKALAYDCLAQIEQNQINLKTINQLIKQQTMEDKQAQTNGANLEGEATDGHSSQPATETGAA